MYARILAKTVSISRSIPDDNNIKLDYLITLHHRYGCDDVNVQHTLLDLANDVLFKYYSSLCDENENLILRQLGKNASKFGSSLSADIILFAINRLYAFSHYRNSDWTSVIKVLNPIIASCPSYKGFYIGGLVDALLMLSESYSALGSYQDSLHSARLAVTISHERLTYIQGINQLQGGQNQTKQQKLMNSLGPILDCFTAVVLTYHNLANQIEKNGDAQHLIVDWHYRALQTAVRFNIDNKILQELQIAQQEQINKILKSNDSSNNLFNNNNDDDVDEEIYSGDSMILPNLILNAKNMPNSSSNNVSLDRRQISSSMNKHSSEEYVEINNIYNDRNSNNNNNNNNNSLHLRLNRINSTESANGSDGNSSSVSGGREIRTRPQSANIDANYNNNYNNDYVENNYDEDGSISGITSAQRRRPRSAASKLGGGYSDNLTPKKNGNSQINKYNQKINWAVIKIQSWGRAYIAKKRVKAIKIRYNFENRRVGNNNNNNHRYNINSSNSNDFRYNNNNTNNEEDLKIQIAIDRALQLERDKIENERYESLKSLEEEKVKLTLAREQFIIERQLELLNIQNEKINNEKILNEEKKKIDDEIKLIRSASEKAIMDVQNFAIKNKTNLEKNITMQLESELARVKSAANFMSNIALVDSKISSNLDDIEEGMMVESESTDLPGRTKGTWELAKVIKKRLDGTFDLIFADGEIERYVNVHMIRLINKINEINIYNDNKNSKICLDLTSKLEKSNIKEEIKENENVLFSIPKIDINFKKSSVSSTLDLKKNIKLAMLVFGVKRNAKIQRDKNSEDMHDQVKKIYEGIASRKTSRMLKKNKLFYQKAVIIQSLMRGILCRNKSLKYRDQLLRGKYLQAKEQELIIREKELATMIEEYHNIKKNNQNERTNNIIAKSKALQITSLEVPTDDNRYNDEFYSKKNNEYPSNANIQLSSTNLQSSRIINRTKSPNNSNTTLNLNSKFNSISPTHASLILKEPKQSNQSKTSASTNLPAWLSKITTDSIKILEHNENTFDFKDIFQQLNYKEYRIIETQTSIIEDEPEKFINCNAIETQTFYNNNAIETQTSIFDNSHVIETQTDAEPVIVINTNAIETQTFYNSNAIETQTFYNSNAIETQTSIFDNSHVIETQTDAEPVIVINTNAIETQTSVIEEGHIPLLSKNAIEIIDLLHGRSTPEKRVYLRENSTNYIIADPPVIKYTLKWHRPRRWENKNIINMSSIVKLLTQSFSSQLYVLIILSCASRFNSNLLIENVEQNRVLTHVINDKIILNDMIYGYYEFFVLPLGIKNSELCCHDIHLKIRKHNEIVTSNDNFVWEFELDGSDVIGLASNDDFAELDLPDSMHVVKYDKTKITHPPLLPGLELRKNEIIELKSSTIDIGLLTGSFIQLWEAHIRWSLMGPLIRFSFLNLFDEIIKKLTKKINNNDEEDEEEIEYWSNEINKALVSCRQIFCDDYENLQVIQNEISNIISNWKKSIETISNIDIDGIDFQLSQELQVIASKMIDISESTIKYSIEEDEDFDDSNYDDIILCYKKFLQQLGLDSLIDKEYIILVTKSCSVITSKTIDFLRTSSWRDWQIKIKEDLLLRAVIYNIEEMIFSTEKNDIVLDSSGPSLIYFITKHIESENTKRNLILRKKIENEILVKVKEGTHVNQLTTIDSLVKFISPEKYVNEKETTFNLLNDSIIDINNASLININNVVTDTNENNNVALNPINDEFIMELLDIFNELWSEQLTKMLQHVLIAANTKKFLGELIIELINDNTTITNNNAIENANENLNKMDQIYEKLNMLLENGKTTIDSFFNININFEKKCFEKYNTLNSKDMRNNCIEIEQELSILVTVIEEYLISISINKSSMEEIVSNEDFNIVVDSNSVWKTVKERFIICLTNYLYIFSNKDVNIDKYINNEEILLNFTNAVNDNIEDFNKYNWLKWFKEVRIIRNYINEDQLAPIIVESDIYIEGECDKGEEKEHIRNILNMSVEISKKLILTK